MQLNGGTGLFFDLILHPLGFIPQNDNNERRREWTVLVISTCWPLTRYKTTRLFLSRVLVEYAAMNKNLVGYIFGA